MHVLEGLLGILRKVGLSLCRHPGFATIAILTLALGIGAVTAIFSVVYGVLLKPLPFHEPERLVSVQLRAPGWAVPVLGQSPATYFTYRESNRVFEDIALWTTLEVSISERGEPERVQAFQVTDGLLPLLRVQPLLGRFFDEEDDAPGSRLRTVLAYGYWQRRFGSATDVIGRSLNIDGMRHEIIGVLPPSFAFIRRDPAVLMPFKLNRAEAYVGNFSYDAIARLKAGVTVDAASADVARMTPLAFDRFPLFPGATRKMLEEVRLGPIIRPLFEDEIDDVRRVLWILLGTVGIVLLIACANVANLFLVRTEGRQQELAIRTAIGASRARIARDLLSESVGLALAGGIVGLVLASAGIRLLAWIAPPALPRMDDIGIDPVVLLFTLAISVVTGLLFGLVPVIRFGRPNVAALKEGGRSASDAPGRHRARNLLVVSEVALALILLIVSGLMIRTFIALQRVDPGFVRPEQVQTFRVSVPKALVESPQQAMRTHEQIAYRLQHVPGVVSVGLSSSLTMDGYEKSGDPIIVEGLAEASGAVSPIRRFKWVTPGYFETMGRRTIAGRGITWADVHQARPVVVISENLAREYWKNPDDAIGKRIREGAKGPWREVIGVVSDERDHGLDEPAPAIVYWPILIRQFSNQPMFVARDMAYAVRSDRLGSSSFLGELQGAVWSVNPSLPLANVRTLGDIRAGAMAQASFALVMLTIAATVALLLGVVGIYAVIGYITAQRTREIGIRMALGAQAGDVRRLFLRHGLVLTLTGIAIGIGAAMLLTRLMAALLFGVSASDPTTYTAVSAMLVAVALLAMYLPARHAARIDPIVALRSDV